MRNETLGFDACDDRLRAAAAASTKLSQRQYDESKVPKYTLPDPLVMADGKKVTDAKTWKEKRRPELLRLFETHVYGRTMVGRPKEMTWEVAIEDRQPKTITKTVKLYFAGRKDGPSMDLTLTLPNTGKRVPVFLLASGRSNQLILEIGRASCRERV